MAQNVTQPPVASNEPPQLSTLVRAACEQAPAGLLIFDTELRYVLVNPAMAQMSNAREEDLLGRSVREAFPDYEALTVQIERVLATGEPLVGFDVAGQVPGEGGVEHVWSLSAYRLLDDDGALVGVAVTSTEVTEQRALERERVALAKRLELLAASAELLSGGLDQSAAVEGVLTLAVPAVAEWACLHLVDETDGAIKLAALRHADPHRQLQLEQVLEVFQVTTSQPFGVGQVIATGRAVELLQPTDEMLAGYAEGDLSDLAGFRALHVNQGLVVPLAARGVTFGALSMSWPVGPEEDGQAGLGIIDAAEAVIARQELIADVAARASLALDNARLFAQQHEVAVTLQRSLLPQSLPKVAGWDIAAQYLPGAAGTEVGGDFYEALTQADGRLLFAIGDVMGRGVRAAAVMGQVRAALRGYALEGHTPAGVLRRLNVMVSAMEDSSAIVTCLVGSVDLSSGEIEIASAGHMPPVQATEDGSCGVLNLEPGPPLGVPGGEYAATRSRLPWGGVLVLFTDGLVEAREQPVDDGIAALCLTLDDVFRPTMGEPPVASEVCAAAVTRMGRGLKTVDDVAVLVLRRLEDGSQYG